MRIILASGLALALFFGYLGATKGARPLAQALTTKVPAPPVLTNEQKLQFQVLMQRLEIAKLKYDAAQADFTAAQKDAAALVAQTKVEGYDLDLQTFSYVRTPTAAPPLKK
jgi:outer membrane PBP1 activator LpoA protein